MNRHEFLKIIPAAASLLVASRSWCDQPADVRTFTYKTADGCDLKLDALGSDPNVKKPVMVHIHGGALIVGNRTGAPKWLRPPSGYVWISIEYRLAPETKLPAIIEDVQGVFRWIHEQGSQLLNIDPQKITVIGESAGGYLTLMTGFCVQPRPQALVSISGYGDIDGPWLSRPDPHHSKPHVTKEEAESLVGSQCVTDGDWARIKFYLYCRQNGIWPREVSGHNPDTEPRWFDRYCPVRNVSPDYPPTVLVHGTADTDVPHEESVAMDKALTQSKVTHKFISVDGGGHVLEHLAASEQTRIFEEALTFAKEHSA